MHFKAFLISLLPPTILKGYHYVLASLAAFWYGYPSRKMVVIGVTGTNGKSSTVQYLGQMLESMGAKVGWTTTVSVKVADKEIVNDQKMTMLGRFQTHALLRQMVKAGCQYALVETSSQGIAQFRHVGIAYDVLVFTNLAPEHIEAHGGFDAYKKAKQTIFRELTSQPRKQLSNKDVPKMILANTDDAHAKDFLAFPCDHAYGFGFVQADREGFYAGDLHVGAEALSFTLENQRMEAPLLGAFNAKNVLAAASVCRALGYSVQEVAQAAGVLHSVPGRMERIDEGQPFLVYVDYAYEPAALQAVYETLDLLSYQRLIQVIGSAGGGRDKSRRRVLGEMVAQKADEVMVTNEDPYDEDPLSIIHAVADGARAGGKQDERDLFLVLDRQEAIRLAIAHAKPQDLVLITGKGCEPVMAVAGGKKIPWDDRAAVRRALHACGYATH
jgi:UDP-N-acetylmuramoyl-L-alanyl-D-glutamate--2,6-diaminopimelate ligase